MTGFIDPLEIASGEPTPETGSLPAPPTDDPAVLERVRDLVLQAHREVVPELVGGASLTELLASIEPAREAYANLADRIQGEREPEPVLATLPLVPAGGTGPAPIDLDRMPASEKLRRGILQRAQATRS